MKKKLLAAAVLAAMTLSTASVFASPVFSGDARVRHQDDSNKDASFTNRIRLVADADIVENFYVHGRLVMNNDLKDNGIDGNDIKADQIYVGARMDNLDLKVGKQPLFLGKGLLADIDGISGVAAATGFDGIRLNAFYGKDNALDLTPSIKDDEFKADVAAADLSTTLGAVNIGASYLKAGEKFLGINADTKLSPIATLNVEFVKNNDTKADGYMAEVKFGNAVKKGDLDYAVSYRNIDDGAIVNGYSTEDNYNDSKGFKVAANYKVSDASKLAVWQDITQTQLGADKNRTNVEFVVNF